MTTTNLSANADKSLAKIKVFENPEFGKVRTVLIDEEPYFVGKDVALALGYSNARDAINKHVDNEDKGVANCDTLGGKQGMTIINESGLYSLILSSKLESAKKFRRWVTSEVLPSIRKTGGYSKPVSPSVEKPYTARIECAKFLHELANEYAGKSENYKQILDAYATKEIADEFLLPLPEMSRKSYSAGEIGKILGISASKVGAIAIKNNLKIDEFGLWVHDKSKYSNKEVDTFRYYDSAIPEIRKFIADKKVIAETADKWLAAEKRR